MAANETDLYPDLFSARSSKVYLDHNATTPVCGKVLDSLSSLASAWGNPSSIHQFGRSPKKLMREARSAISNLLSCHPLELIFTSCGSESNTTVLRSEFYRNKRNSQKPVRFLISTVEHPSIMSCVRDLQREGLIVDWIEVDRELGLNLEQYKTQLQKSPVLVSCMMANNETGVIFPIKEMVVLAKEVGALFHTDAVQALGKLQFNLKDLGVDYASFAGHKFYALKGVSVLFSKQGNQLESLVSGGGQERARRGGTENTMAIASLGIVASMHEQIPGYIERTKLLRNNLEKQISQKLDGVSINGQNQNRVCNTSSMLIDGIDGESLLMNLDMEGFAVSTGAACSSGNPEPSPVLIAMGYTRFEAQRSLRVSLGYGTNQEEINAFVDILTKVVLRLRKLKLESVDYGKA